MITKQTKVFVIDKDGKPCLPTTNRRAKQLLTKGKASVYLVFPFIIKLNYSIENPVGEFHIGIDDGKKYVGFAIMNEFTKEIVFYGVITLRQDVSRKVKERKLFRKTRRNRKLRHRKIRFSNRTRKGTIPHSIRYRKDAILRVIKFFMRFLNLTIARVEEVAFNHTKYTWGREFSYVETGKTYLKEQILALGLEYERTFGYNTKPRRLELGLSKKHANDAIAIVYQEGNDLKISSLEYQIKPRRTKIWENNPSKKCEEKNGFRHYDIVKSHNKNKGWVVGSVRSLNEKQIVLRTKFKDRFAVSYSNSKLLQRPKGLIFSR